ncbi:quinol monooxygenase YgiN [Nocardioides sp. J9]|uniref:putative quinol monooxygenase n=1 Tax=Nocardioides sp. J9 TaxID=935844 RepID=UPI00119D2332|nr:antibiotic biosynthesis monooxygenase [Nocardioides sp. J9]TWG98562.1 quinol monooxygenase YgiN [Nocardioides sp. J9]
MSQIAQFARFPAKPGRGADVVAALETALAAARGEAGTQVYAIHVQPDDADVVWMYELYESAQAQANHSSSEATAALRAAVGDLLDGSLTVSRGSIHAGFGLPGLE